MRRSTLFAALLLAALPATADGLWWSEVTTDINGRTISGVTYQIYEDGSPYGAVIAAAPTRDKMVSVPNCTTRSYYVVALYSGLSSTPSNTVTPTSCAPTSPTLQSMESAQLAACNAERKKLWADKIACKAALNVERAKH